VRRTHGQYGPDGHRHGPARNSLHLMQAVLEDGIRVLLQTAAARNARAARRWREEMLWMSSRDRSHPFTFDCLCEALGIDARRLRRRTLVHVHQILARAAIYSLPEPRGTRP
jgi:hypothetical protein